MKEKAKYPHNINWILECYPVLSRVRLFATPMDCSPPGSSVHGISQARILEWVSFPPPGDLPDPGIEPHLLIADGFFTTETLGKPDFYG